MINSAESLPDQGAVLIDPVVQSDLLGHGELLAASVTGAQAQTAAVV
jgi:hypothetical protein